MTRNQTMKPGDRWLVRDLIIECHRAGSRTKLSISHADGEPVQIIRLPEKPAEIAVSESES